MLPVVAIIIDVILMISLKKKFLFIHVPKTGGNSIQNILRDYSEDEIVAIGKHQDGIERFEVRSRNYNITKHSTLSDYKSVLDPNIYDQLLKFAVIRNPWDMMVSYYFSPHRGVTEWNRIDFINLLYRVPTLRYYICEDQPAKNKILAILRKNTQEVSADINFLIRFEHLNDDFILVCKKLGIAHNKLPVRNKSPRAHYSKYYDDELKTLVGEKFHEEISIGNYTFENRLSAMNNRK